MFSPDDLRIIWQSAATMQLVSEAMMIIRDRGDEVTVREAMQVMLSVVTPTILGSTTANVEINCVDNAGVRHGMSTSEERRE
jgi:hypothetical protein